MMDLKKPFATFDIEATGLDLQNDRIVELSIRKQVPGLMAPLWFVQRFNPGRPMEKKAAEVTGIRDEDLVAEPTFASVCIHVLGFLDGCDLLGFNLFQYDIPMLQAEFARCGIEFNLEGRAIIDAGNIFKKKEERTLSAALKHYCHREHDSAHTAVGDVQATYDVFVEQMARYQDLAGMSLEDIGTFSRFGVDMAGKFGKDEDGEYIYNFGKHKGQKVKDHRGFAEWMLGKDFTPDTKAWARRIIEETSEELRMDFDSHYADVAPFGGPF